MRSARTACVSPIVRMATVVAASALITAAIALPLRKHLADPFTRIRTYRVVEARLTEFDHEGLQVSRSAPRDSDLDTLEAIKALAIEVDRARTPENLHRLGVAKVASGNAREAMPLLREAVMGDTANAAFLSDLAAAELALGHIFDAAEDSARALELDPKRAAAAFNWALALEQTSNRAVAIDAWVSYLALDPDGGWAEEARTHLERLRAPRSAWEKERDLLVPGVDAETVRRLVRDFP